MRNSSCATQEGFFVLRKVFPMATCTNCTRTLPDDTERCPFCGRRIAAAADAVHSDLELLHQFKQLLRGEQKCLRTAWLLLATVSAVLLTETVFSFLAGKWIALLIYGILALYGASATLVNLLMHGQTQACIEGLYLDCTPALEQVYGRRYTVLSIFFNPRLAVLLKKKKQFVAANQAALIRIMQDQDRRYNSTFRNDLLHINP